MDAKNCVVCEKAGDIQCFCKSVWYCNHICRKEYEKQHYEECY